MSFEPLNIKWNPTVTSSSFPNNREGSNSHTSLRKQKEEEENNQDIFYSNEELEVSILEEDKNSSIIKLLIEFIQNVADIVLEFLGFKLNKHKPQNTNLKK